MISVETNTCYSRLSDALSTPNFYQVDANLFTAAFSLMKLLPAKYVIEKAIREQQIDPRSSVVVETSSGTYALGLAIVCCEHKIPFHIVSDPVLDCRLKERLELLGGSVEIVVKGQESPQVERLKAVHRFLDENAQGFWPRQYDNREHLEAYAPFADFLLRHLGRDFILVASVGSGSSSCGTIQKLRDYNTEIKLIGVDTFGSVLFGGENAPRVLRGLGNSLSPKNLFQNYFDQVHWISARTAFCSTRRLLAQTALYVGPTSGGCYHVARWVAKMHPDKKVVWISPDEGHRYANSVFCTKWMEDQGYREEGIPLEPSLVTHPREVNGSKKDWVWMDWRREPIEKYL